MKDNFEKELQRILRRAHHLRAAIDGSAEIVRVKVRGCTVAEHRRGAHERLVIKLRKDRKR